MRKIILILAALSCLPVSTSLASTNDEIAELRSQISRLARRVAELEARATTDGQQQDQTPASTLPPAKTAATSPAPATTPSSHWADSLKLSGDLRYRHEAIDQQGADERVRHRIRARFGLKAKPADNLEVGIRIATGGDDPVSTNQSLDSSFSTKDLGLDLAYIKMDLPGAHSVTAGKMKNPLPMGGSSLLWDSDLTPEGLAWSLLSDRLFVDAVGFSIEERSSASDTLMWGARAGVRTKLNDRASLSYGAGYYDYAAVRGRSPLGIIAGNSLDGSGNYRFDYRLTELFVAMDTVLNDLPLSMYVDWVKNTQATSADTGIAIGLSLGKARRPGQWSLGYTYKDVEADAVLAAFTDSDFGGGGTAVEGHVLSFGYAITQKLAGKLTYIVSENRTNTISARDYDRLQADFSVKY